VAAACAVAAAAAPAFAAATAFRTSTASASTAARSARSSGTGARLDLHASTADEQQLTVRDDDLTRLEALFDDHVLGNLSFDRYVPQLSRLFWRDDEDVISGLTVLHGRRWDDGGVGVGLQRDRDVVELSRPEAPFLILKRCLDLDLTRRRINGVVDE